MQLMAIDNADVPLMKKVFCAINDAIHLMIDNPDHFDLVMPMYQIVLVILPVICFH